MSKQALAQIVQRAISDGAFRRQLASDSATALRGFDLTPDEAAAIRSGDSGRLSALGVDVRMSKAFTLGTGDLINEGASISDLKPGYNAAATTGVTGPTSNDALVAGEANDNSAMIDPGMTSVRVGPDSALGVAGAHTGGDGSTLEGADATDGGAGLDAADVSDSSAAYLGADIDAGSTTVNAADAVADADAAGGGPGDAINGPSIQP